ncbi:dihydrofolate reductase family protein [Rathayibacter soli]|uniref:dihydrofolate reductase family protein n=1 Tax=Rathayibacter soli TaxID=3144168 RepID=UPI0027E3CCA4|nr:dihydrofolate reductase family protein [Glaciibacter superstes]
MHLFSFMAVSADGYHSTLDRDVGWQTFGPEFTEYSAEQLDEVDTLVLGRVTYEEMVAFWMSDVGSDFDARIADRMNSLAKFVVSRSLQTVNWGASDISLTTVEGIAELKTNRRGSAAILGSSGLTATLLRAHLVDELRLMVNPVILDEGQKLFAGSGTVP